MRPLAAAALTSALVAAPGCSADGPSCADAPASVVEAAGFPALSASASAITGGDGAWFVGIPAELTSVRPEVAVFASAVDPASGAFDGPLLPANELAEGTVGRPGGADAFAGSEGVLDATTCVRDRTEELSG